MITDITSVDHYKQIICQNNVSIVDFDAAWAAPSKAILPTFKSLAAQYGTINFCKIDVDEHANVAQEAGARVYPTFILFKGGAMVKTISGANPDGLKTLVQTALRL